VLRLGHWFMLKCIFGTSQAIKRSGSGRTSATQCLERLDCSLFSPRTLFLGVLQTRVMPWVLDGTLILTYVFVIARNHRVSGTLIGTSGAPPTPLGMSLCVHHLLHFETSVLGTIIACFITVQLGWRVCFLFRIRTSSVLDRRCFILERQ
jgi:hypothetical protein